MPPADFRKTLDGIWWILVTGSIWNQLPERYGKWNSVYRFHLRWAHKGVFNQLLAIHAAEQNACPFKVIDATHIKVHQDACRHPQPAVDRCLGKTKGGRNSKLHVCVNGRGKAIFLLLRPGNEREVLTALDVLQDVGGKIVFADRGYDSDKLRSQIDAAGGIPVIPPKKGRTNEVFYVSEIGRNRRVVENFSARVKRHRRVNTPLRQSRRNVHGIRKSSVHSGLGPILICPLCLVRYGGHVGQAND